jgi:hypothetical protein
MGHGFRGLGERIMMTARSGKVNMGACVYGVCRVWKMWGRVASATQHTGALLLWQ